MTDFKTLQKLKTSISNCDFPCKLILNKGIFAQLPDGFLINLEAYSFMRASTLTKWLNVLYLIRKETT